MNKQSNTKKYNLGSKGFTLVELLAVIALLAIISVIIVYVSVDVVGSAKQKSYEVSISNIEKQAGAYATENKNNFMWLDVPSNSTSTKQYFCVSVQDLIDTGYFKNDVLDSYIKEGVTVNSTDKVYLERDKNTKTLEKNILLSSTDENYNGLCDNISTNGNIRFNVVPSGWAKKKEITITYKLFNNLDNVENYQYSYSFTKKDDTERDFKDDNFDNNTVVEKVIIEENGELRASINIGGINEILQITTIDNSSPQIVINVENESTYSKNKKAEIILVDNESGFKSGNYNIYYKWSMSDMSCEQLKSSGEKATLVVERDNSNTSSSVDVNIDKETGAGKLYVCGDNITDYVGNKMEDTVTTKDVLLDNKKPVVSLGTYNGDSEVSNKVIIPLVVTDEHSGVDSNMFTVSDIIVTIGRTELTSGISLNKVTDSNYNLVINNNTLNGDVLIKINQDGVYDNAGNSNEEITLNSSIKFENIYKISYDANGGTGSMADTECIYGENCTLRANTFIRTGYTFLGWSTDSSSTTETYQNGYTYEPFNQTNNITLYAVWKINTYTVTSRYYYYYQNTTWTIFSTKTDTVSYGDAFTPYNVSAPSGYHARNSYNYYDASGKVLGAGTVGSGKFLVTQNMQVNVYYDPNQYTISYDANGGSGAPASQTKIYDIDLTLSNTKPTRTGYTFLGWSESATATSKTYDAGGNYISDASATLYAVWKLDAKCYRINISQGRNCRNKPSLSGSSVVIAIPNGWYVEVDETVAAGGYTWYHYVQKDCYFISDNAIEYTPEDGICPVTSSSSSGSSSPGNSLSGGNDCSCGTGSHRVPIMKNESCYCCTIGTKDPLDIPEGGSCYIQY